uniref:Rab9 effector protein with kelch motifs n=1 Tax=Terrapene triunguis TaxID=2587831 RepID=A0A674J1N2_9SAUR
TTNIPVLPSPNLCVYTLVPLGESPSARVGHNCLYLPPVPTAGKGKVVIVGGADPNGSFSDAHIIDLDRHQWAMPGWVGLLPRYEHATFIPRSSPTSLWVFGGADQSGNRNCVQVLNLGKCVVESTYPSLLSFFIGQLDMHLLSM